MADDTDSDWDSSVLDFSVTPRGPRVIGFNQQPPKEMDAIEETSEHSRAETQFPKKDNKPLARDRRQEGISDKDKGNNTRNKENEKKDQFKNSVAKSFIKQRSSAKETGDVNPPYNFQGMFTEDREVAVKQLKVPGKSRKGNVYNHNPLDDDTKDINLWGDSEEEERVLQNIRDNFTGPKPSGSVYSSAKRKDSKPSADLDTGPSALDFSNDVRTNNEMPVKHIHHHEVNALTPDFHTDKTVNGVQSTPVNQPTSGSFVKQVLVQNASNGKRYRYHFNHSDMQYYDVEDVDQDLIMPRIAERVEKIAGRGLQEMFGCLRMVFVCVVLFLIELSKFMFGVIFGPLLSGVLGAIGDHVIKPVSAAVFNSVVHPLLTLLYNVLSGLRYALSPVLLLSREFLNQVAMVLQAIRLVHVTNTSYKSDRPSIQDV